MIRDLCLQAKRIYLRPLTQKDAPRLQTIAGVPEIAGMMRSVTLPWEDAKVAEWIDQSKWRGHLGFRLGICLKNETLIGTIGIGRDADIAYFIGLDYWKNGFASEALHLFLTWIYMSYDVPHIDAEVLDDNPASSAILRKFGFIETGQGTCKSLARVEAEASTLYRLTQDVFEDRNEIS